MTSAGRIFLAVCLTLANCSDENSSTRQDARTTAVSTVDEDELTTLAVQRILRHVAVADVRVKPSSICVARSAELGGFEPAPPGVIKELRIADTRIVPASECVRQEQEWGRVIHRSDSQPSILVGARPYIFEQDGRAFVLGSWYVNTMRAQRFIFVFRRQDGHWKLDDGSKLGVV